MDGFKGTDGKLTGKIVMDTGAAKPDHCCNATGKISQY
jgi:hypothetical protein